MASKKAQRSKPKIEIYKDSGRNGKRKDSGFIRRHPWESVGVAALLGALVGRLLFRKRR